MKCYQYGQDDQPIIMLLPGGLMHHSFYDVVLSFLTKDYCCIVVSYDGFDEQEETSFVSFEQEAAKIEDYLQIHHGGRLFALYGTMSGGLLATLLMARGYIQCEHVILGSTTFHEKSLTDRWQLRRAIKAYKMDRMREARVRFQAYEHDHMFYQGLLRYYTQDLSFISDQTITNYLTSCYQLRFMPMALHTHVHVLYAAKMGEACLYNYISLFKNLHIAFYPTREEELLIAYPDRWYLALQTCFQGVENWKNPWY